MGLNPKQSRRKKMGLNPLIKLFTAGLVSCMLLCSVFADAAKNGKAPQKAAEGKKEKVENAKTEQVDIDEQVLCCIPNSASAIIKVNLQKLRELDLYKTLINKNQFTYQKFLEGAISEAGIDPRDIETVWIVGEKRNRGFLVVVGKFDALKIEEILLDNQDVEFVEREGCHLAVRLPDRRRRGKKVLGVIIDDSLLAIGDTKLVDGFIEIYSGEKPMVSDATLKERKEVYSGNELVNAKLFKIPDSEKRKQPMMANIRSGRMCIDVDQDGLKIKTTINCTSKEQCAAISQIMNGMLILGKNTPANGNNVQPGVKIALNKNRTLTKLKSDFLNNVKIQQNGATLTASTKLDRAVLEKMINAPVK